LKAYSRLESVLICVCMCASTVLTLDRWKMHRAANNMPMEGAGQTPAAIYM